MSEAKHTPGPWWETETGVRDRGGYICHTIPAYHYPGQDERFEKETVERAANKTLITAAPELLARLEETQALLAAMLHERRPRGEIEKQMLDNRSAIAKATGAAA